MSYLTFLFFITNTFFVANSIQNCSKTSRLIGLESEFIMLQHQLRGMITLIDDCSFKVREFDMIQGADVHWWGSVGQDFENLTKGFQISDHMLNQTYKNDTFIVHLSKNVSWDQINVVSIWDKPTASDYGHVVLRSFVNGTNTSALAPSPGPAPAVNVSKESGNYSYKQPTMFDNCKSLSDKYRLRWTLSPKAEKDEGFIEIGLEAIVESQYYMAFGWADPGSSSGDEMLHADVCVTAFTEEGLPFADDYYVSQYSECLLNKDGTVNGVCPDTIYEGSDPVGLVNNTRLVYGHRRDGVSFIRYRRPLESADRKYDVRVNQTENMTVIWALGLISPPDSLRPYYLPQNHTGPLNVSYGHLILNVSEHVNDCLGPLVAEDREDQDLVSAVGQSLPLAVTTSPALHYPNPPNPSKVLYINKKEAPLLSVERGVPVKFSIQAGHDVAFYITSDPIGGNATLRNMSETIYFGGPEAEGVPASPKELVWYPDRNTPDQLFYHSLYVPKMGWKVQVVDGGLSDMYNNSVLLDDQQVTFFWTVSNDSISMAARGEKKSGYLAIGFGSGMVASYAYVGWVDDMGKARVNTYWIDGRDASNVHPTNENLTYVRCKSEKGIITFEFTRPLIPSCHGSDKPECNNKVDPTTPFRVVWAMGAQWSKDHLSERNMHSVTSSRPVRVLLLRGSAEAEQELRPVLAVHGFMMFVAWGILLPGGILSARYLKHVEGDGWFKIHVYLQQSGLVIVLLALLFAVVELRGFNFSSVHVKIGFTAIVLACAQPVNASLRPREPSGEEEMSPRRVIWEYLHVITGRCAIVAGIAALLTGMKHLGDRYGGQNVHELKWALIIWFLVVALVVIYLEYQETRQRRRDGSLGRSNWVLGNVDEDDSMDLLRSDRSLTEVVSHPSERMELQLQPLSR